jgi:HAD superfamily hydrolase (TIGR01549 family)
MYDGLLLDHDGVIVGLAEETTLREAAAAALRDAGVDDPAADAVETLTIGVSEADLTALGRRYDLAPENLWCHRDDRVQEALGKATTAGRKTPYEDTAVLREVDLPMGIVSNNQTRIVEAVLDHHGLRDLFGTIRAREPTRASLSRKKPEPDFLEAAMADLGIENPLYVGDSESDVLAGQRAGVDTAFLRRGHNADRTIEHTPTYEIRGLDEAVALLAEGP